MCMPTISDHNVPRMHYNAEETSESNAEPNIWCPPLLNHNFTGMAKCPPERLLLTIRDTMHGLEMPR